VVACFWCDLFFGGWVWFIAAPGSLA
jgi:hypothetical protein